MKLFKFRIHIACKFERSLKFAISLITYGPLYKKFLNAKHNLNLSVCQAICGIIKNLAWLSGNLLLN